MTHDVIINHIWTIYEPFLAHFSPIWTIGGPCFFTARLRQEDLAHVKDLQDIVAIRRAADQDPRQGAESLLLTVQPQISWEKYLSHGDEKKHGMNQGETHVAIENGALEIWENDKIFMGENDRYTLW